MKRSQTLLALGLLLFAGALAAISPDLPLRYCVRESWQTDRGLPQNSIQAMVQSRDGYVWLATQDGLARFDGLRFTVFSRATHPQMPANFIWSLLEDRAGRLWCGTSEGGIFYLSVTGEMVTIPDRVSGDVRVLCEDGQGTIWLGLGKEGLGCIQKDRLVIWNRDRGFPADQVLALTLDERGGLLVGTEQGVFEGTPPFVPWPGNKDLPATEVTSLLSGVDGLWVGTRRGLLHWQNGKSVVYDSRSGLGADYVWTLYRDRSGTVWAGMNGGGLARFHDKRLIESFTHKQGLANNAVWSLLEDREGGLWIGSNGGGLSRYRTGMFINMGAEEGLGSGPYSAVCEGDDGRLWVGTWWDGCYVLSPTGVRHLTRENGLPDNNVNSLCADGRGGMWIGTENGGLVHIGPEGNERIDTRSGLAHNQVNAICRAGDETLWVGTSLGVQGQRNGAWLPPIANLARVGVRVVLAEPDGGLWIGSDGRGLFAWRRGKLRQWTRAHGLASNKIFSLCADGRGGLWVGTEGGVCHITRSGRVLGSAVPQLNGSPVFQILADGRGEIYLSGNRGVTVLTAPQVADVLAHRPLQWRARLLGRADGMVSEECSGGFQPAGCLTRDGRLCWPTIRSLAVIDPQRVVINSQPPILKIEKVHGDGREYTDRSGLIFPPGTRNLSFRFAAISHNCPQKVRCHYRLDGFDRDWVEPDPANLRHINYTNLSPGRYRLRLRAENEDGIESKQVTGLAFSIRPFFYQTALFRLALLLLFMVLSYFLVSGIKRYLFLVTFWRRQRLVGAYLLEQPLGHGGSATVYKARHILVRSRVAAIKLLKEEYAQDPVQSRRFHKEAALIDRFNHPNIVRIIERGTHGNTLYIAMEFLAGTTLADRLQNAEPLEIKTIVHILNQIAAALAFLHEKSIVHRDLKPRNVMLIGAENQKLQVKLLDFGIAKTPDHTALTETGMMLGTLAYLAPEQIQQGRNDPASDMHALGVIAFEMVAGRLPYAAATAAALMRQIIFAKPEFPDPLHRDCPKELANLILELLAKEPGQRPTALQLLHRLFIGSN